MICSRYPHPVALLPPVNSVQCNAINHYMDFILRIRTLNALANLCFEMLTAKTVQTKFDASILHQNTKMAAETQMFDDGTGSVQVKENTMLNEFFF